MLLEAVVSALIPIGVQAANKYLNTGVKPATVEDQVALNNSEVERIKALAELDNVKGTPSQWVIDLRSSARYVGALFVIFIGLSCLLIPIAPTVQSLALEAANIAFGFLFGSRIVSNFIGKK